MGCADGGQVARRRGTVAGKWVLMDVRLQVLSIGDLLYTGQSPKGLLTSVDRTVLLPQIMTAARTRAGQELVTDLGKNGRFDVEALPLLDPADGTVTAVHACYVPSGEPMPPRPGVGAWQWRVDLTDRRSVTAIWSPEVFDLFGLDRPPAAAAEYPDGNRLPGSYFFHELVDDAWSSTVHQAISEGVSATTDKLFFRDYRIRDRASGVDKNMRMVARRLLADPYAGATVAVARGCTMEVNTTEHAYNQHGAEPTAAALFSLSRDALAVVNTDFFHIWQANRQLDGLGIHIPSDRRLQDMCHPDDLAALLRMLTRAAGCPGAVVPPIEARFVEDGTGYRTLEVTGIGIPGAQDGTKDVACRFTPAR
ncbi:hypothetical protein [Amycolatopsis minnesotensis]|uniref:PAS domain-containing protein n=1 Tax=Amycolatopsis minnesotensis TaxID=337894 RepID=A0ABN2QAK7_9PSEU